MNENRFEHGNYCENQSCGERYGEPANEYIPYEERQEIPANECIPYDGVYYAEDY